MIRWNWRCLRRTAISAHPIGRRAANGAGAAGSNSARAASRMRAASNAVSILRYRRSSPAMAKTQRYRRAMPYEDDLIRYWWPRRTAAWIARDLGWKDKRAVQLRAMRLGIVRKS